MTGRPARAISVEGGARRADDASRLLEDDTQHLAPVVGVDQGLGEAHERPETLVVPAPAHPPGREIDEDVLRRHDLERLTRDDGERGGVGPAGPGEASAGRRERPGRPGTAGAARLGDDSGRGPDDGGGPAFVLPGGRVVVQRPDARLAGDDAGRGTDVPARRVLVHQGQARCQVADLRGLPGGGGEARRDLVGRAAADVVRRAQ